MNYWERVAENVERNNALYRRLRDQMSALMFYEQAPIFCRKCGDALMEVREKDPPNVREVWCPNPQCSQFERRGKLVSPTIVALDRTSEQSDYVVNAEPEPLPPADDDPNGRC